jgi:hypothetical protein
MSAVFATQVALPCKAKPALQLKHVATVAVKQDAQFVPHAVAEVMTVATHAAVPVYPVPQAVQVRALTAIVHAEQPTTKPVAVAVAAGTETPVWQLTQLPAVLTMYPALQTVQVAATVPHKRQFPSEHAVAQRAGEALLIENPAAHVVHVASAVTPETPT